jgi:hypothetical protein
MPRSRFLFPRSILHGPKGLLGVSITAAALLGSAGAPPLDAQAIGLSAVGAQRFFNEDLLFFEPEPGDRFATVLVAGDFDGDGADDLATGMPFDDGFANGGGPVNSGSVVVRYGVAGSGLAGGLATTVLNQLAGGSSNPADEGDAYGFALAACDFDGDGDDDLAVGVPNEEGPGAIPDADLGAVHIYYGRPTGLSADDDAFYDQNTPGIPGNADVSERFGRALACGDFDGDGFDDLAVGVPLDRGGSDLAGAVNVIPGSSSGLDPASATILHQDTFGMDGSPELGDEFGFALAVGDFDGDGFDDLAVGVPGEGFDPPGTFSGAVHVVQGAACGLPCAAVVPRNLLFIESFVGGDPENGDRFGSVLAAGDFDGDGFDDLVVGVPDEDLGGAEDCGHVVELFGSSSGIVASTRTRTTSAPRSRSGTSTVTASTTSPPAIPESSSPARPTAR